MLASGDWGHTTLNGADRFDKPILVYWLQAASLAVFGATEFAARLPSALCAWAWTLAVAQFAAARWGGRVGVLAAIVLATSAGPLAIGRAATADGLLNLLLTLAGFDLWRALEHARGQGSRSAARVALRRVALWVGLGLLAKGPIALVVPGGAFAVWLVTRRVLAGEPIGPSLRWVSGDAVSWAIVGLVAGPWYLYALLRHGEAFVSGFLVRHNLERFSAPLHGHDGSVVYYLLIVPALMLPWTPLLVPIGRRLRETVASPDGSFLVAWAAFVVAFFSLSGTKLPHYALYGFTPLALLAARELGRQQGCAVALAVCAACAALVTFGAMSPWIAEMVADRRGDPHWRALIDAAALPPGPAAWAAAAIAAIVIGAAGIAWRRPQRAAAAAATAAVAAGLWTISATVPWWGRALQGPIQELAFEARSRGLAVTQWGLHQPSVGFYRGEPAPRRPPAPAESALVRLSRLPALEHGTGIATEPIAAVRGFALVRSRVAAPQDPLGGPGAAR